MPPNRPDPTRTARPIGWNHVPCIANFVYCASAENTGNAYLPATET